MKKTFTLILALLPLAVQAEETLVVSQQADSPSSDYQSLDSVTAMRAPARLLDTPQNVTVVPPALLDDDDARSLDEALGYVSGVTQANTLGGTQDAFIKRGFGDNRDGSILRDGVRSVQARNFTPTSERVEVLKGPSSMLYGMNEPGGLVNIISKKPLLTPRIHLDGRTYGESGGGGGQLDASGPLGTSGFAGRLIVDHDEVDYWRNFGRSRQTVVAPSLSWYGPSTTVNLSWEHMEYLLPFDRGTVIDPRTGKPVSTPRERRFDEAFNATRGDQDTLRAGVEQILSDRWTTQLNYAFSRNRYRDNQARATAFDAVSGLLTRQPDATADAQSRSQLVQATLNGDLDWGRIHHQLLVGMDYEADRTFRGDMIRGTRTRDQFDIWHPQYGVLKPATAISAKDSDQRENIDSRGVFVQDAMRLNDHLQLIGGLRYDRVAVMAGKGRPFITRTESRDSQLVPRVGVVWNLNPLSSLYASYTESFKPNSSIASEIGALPPERGQAWEVGYKLALAQGITGTLALYDIQKRNVMVSELVAGEAVTRTAGKVRSQGIELDLAGQLTERLSLVGSYALTDARITADPENNGNALANVARHTAALFLTRDFGSTSLLAADNLRAGIGARYVGRRAGDAANGFYLDDYTVADAFVRWTLPLGQSRIGWQLNVKNLFDSTYYPSSGGDLRVAVGEPREVVLKASVDF
ncbi:TonB-dependent siderophore receptor [Pantoea sp. 1.19]|uniref:TonB-dependent siderophore receptor n=1 Tax=Pantoea sp. 1.19 TaxID=1925589 RepID=UPI000948D794|nr:TonB-dependent siderophore receptor [Pantoea sp. 1.19]